MRLGYAARIAASLAIFGVVLWFIDARRFATLIADAAPGWLGMALVSCVVAIYLSSHVLVSLCRGRVTPGAVFRVNVISIYMSIFLPGDVAAGLLSRIRYLGMSSWQEVVHRTVVERLVGLACFGLITAAVFSFSTFRVALGWPAILLPLAVLAAALLALAAVKNPGAVARRLPFLKRIFVRFAPGADLPPFALTPAAFAWSIAAQLCMSVLPFAVLRSLGLPIGYFDAIVVGFLLTLAQLIPFFFAGIGIRDVSAMALLGTVGVRPEVAVAFSTLILAVILVLAVTGGLFQMSGERRK